MVYVLYICVFFSPAHGSSQQRARSLSTGVVPTYPKINYMSMSVDETFNAYAHNSIDDIAAKYLPKEFVIEQKHTTMKTVKFEGVCENMWQTPSRGVNMRSVNFSCNMSIASKKYLQKYELVDYEESSVQPLSNVNRRSEDRKQGKHNLTTRNIEECNKENILDFKKIRSLPKLL